MVSPRILFVSFGVIILTFNPIFCKQSYDPSDCYAENATQVPGSRYVCHSGCQAYFIYRVQEDGQDMSFTILSLFSERASDLLSINNLSEADLSSLKRGEEVVIRGNCECDDDGFSGFFVPYPYNLSAASNSLSAIACEVYEGLLKAQTLRSFNLIPVGNLTVQVPIRCACSDRLTESLVTYPIMEGDTIDAIANKFGVLESAILEANSIDSHDTIFPRTTLLIPVNGTPAVNRSITSVPQNSPPVLPLNPVSKSSHSSDATVRYLLLAAGLFAAAVLLSLVCWVLVSVGKRYSLQAILPLSSTWPLQNISPDFLAGLSKLRRSLTRFTISELKIATNNFNEHSAIGYSVYRGVIRGSKLVIEQMDSEETARRVQHILTKINHVNVVKLEGCCYAPRPYLVFEYAENGSLRDCLSSTERARQFTWAKRVQIIHDLAAGLHYLHYSTIPAYVHRDINSQNVLVTKEWRAKITGFRTAKPRTFTEESRELNRKESAIKGRRGYLAPEYLYHGSDSPKVDVYAFGIVVLELLSAKEAIVGEYLLLKDLIENLGDKSPGDFSGKWDKLKTFLDPNLAAAEELMRSAMTLALLAKCCVEDDPIKRPTMDDVLKALSTTIRNS